MKGSISGVLWLDLNDDGFRDADEKALFDHPVYLYQASDVTRAIQVVKTGMGGEYTFTDLGLGIYVVGIKPNELGIDRYLLPLPRVGTGNDNKFKVTPDWLCAITEPLEVTEGAAVTSIDAGLRNPMGIMPLGGGGPCCST